MLGLIQPLYTGMIHLPDFFLQITCDNKSRASPSLPFTLTLSHAPQSKKQHCSEDRLQRETELPPGRRIVMALNSKKGRPKKEQTIQVVRVDDIDNLILDVKDTNVLLYALIL